MLSRSHYIVIGEDTVEFSEMDLREMYNCTLHAIRDKLRSLE